MWFEKKRLETPFKGDNVKALTRLAFKKSLEPSHGVSQLLKKNLYSVLILHLLKPLFSAFHVLQALGFFFCFS